ncbi:MAG: hypothetical protein RBR30_11375 [Tenuifilaceae bacterium]|nr:hypothetical protein [Tenuifilaceae bacterium]
MENIEKYEVNCTNEGFDYYYYFSIGEKGCIKMVAQFIKSPVKRIYQFRYGVIENTNGVGVIDEYIVVNNNDTSKILNTIVWILYNFTNSFPECLIRFSGSTKVRTRLFLMWLTRNWDFANKYFIIFGSNSNEKWVRCKYSIRYSAILVKKKTK